MAVGDVVDHRQHHLLDLRMSGDAIDLTRRARIARIDLDTADEALVLCKLMLGDRHFDPRYRA
jgi:hypothetical protein